MGNWLLRDAAYQFGNFPIYCPCVREKAKAMQKIRCPIDGKPCDEHCRHRDTDAPEGGCFITTAIEMGTNVLVMDERSTE